MDNSIQNIVIGWVCDELRDTKCCFCKCWRKKTDFISNNRIVKSCMNCRKNAKKNNSKNADKRKEYYEKNKEKLLQYQKDYTNKNSNYKEYQKKYYNEHKEDIIKKNTTYYADNKKEYPLNTKAKNMIYSAKESDKTRRGVVEDLNDYIDIPYIHELFCKQQGICWYEDCETKMDYTTFNHYFKNDNIITLQRLNDLLPHTKDNCVLSCFRCNVKRRRQTT